MGFRSVGDSPDIYKHKGSAYGERPSRPVRVVKFLDGSGEGFKVGHDELAWSV